MAAQATKGKKALESINYEEAIQEYTAAIKESPTSPDYFIQRSIAYQRTKKFDEALDDAEQGVINAQKRAKKELITEAQFRRAVALYSLSRYGDADFVLNLVKQRNPDHKQAAMWINKNALAVKSLSEDDERRKCNVKENPTSKATAESSKGKDVEITQDSSAKKENTTSTGESTAASSATVALQQTPADKIRYEWYQNTEKVFFTLLAKGVPKEKAQIDISTRSLNITFPLITGSSYDLTLEPLFAPVQSKDCTTRIMPSKVEITLVKAVPGQKWPALETNEPLSSGEIPVVGAKPPTEDIVKPIVSSETKPTGPAYPTSSKSGPKDWDKITKDLRKADNSGKEGAKEDDNDDDDDYEGDEANAFFKKLFKGASPEMQRAMMKSYTESNGTALSTNWEEVSQAKVETLPPDGMEAKKW